MLEGTSLEGAPTIAVSAESGDGIEALRAMLTDTVHGLTTRSNGSRPRLFIDRSFSVAGFGAVATGTLDGGEFKVGDEVAILPSGKQARIRGLQSHRSEIDVAHPGTRVAVSLSGVSRTEINRGDALVRRRQFKTTTAFDAHLQSIRDVRRPIKHNHRVTLYAGTWEEPAVVRLLNNESLNAGHDGWAQIKMQHPRPIVQGDRFVIRDSNDTLGGGIALVTDAPRHRRYDSAVIEHLSVLTEGKSQDVVMHTLGLLGIATIMQLAEAANLPPDEVEGDIDELIDTQRVLRLGDVTSAFLVSAERYRSMHESAVQALHEYHVRFPLRHGMPRQELRNRIDASSASFDALVDHFATAGEIAQTGTLIRLANHAVKFSEAQEREVHRYLSVLREHRFTPPAWNKIDAELLGALSDRREIVSAGPDVVFAAEAFDEMQTAVVTFCEAQNEISINDVREMLGTSRKYSLALLEQLDRDNVTMRVGDMRKLR